MKKCSRCKQEKQPHQFSKYSKARDGLQGNCKDCQTIINKKFYAENRDREKNRAQACRLKNPELTKATSKKWRKENFERYAEMKKAYRLANLEKAKSQRIENYVKNRERDLESGRKYKIENKERLASYRYKQYWENPDIARSAMTNYRKENPGVAAAWRMSRIASKIQAIPKWFNEDEAKVLYAKADLLKASNGEDYEVDHIVPLQSKIVCGLHVIQNLQVITKSENRKKSNRYWPDMP